MTRPQRAATGQKHERIARTQPPDLSLLSVTTMFVNQPPGLYVPASDRSRSPTAPRCLAVSGAEVRVGPCQIEGGEAH